MTVILTTRAFDVDGAELLNEDLRASRLRSTSRRLARTADMAAGVELIDAGYTDADRTFTIVVPSVTGRQVRNLRRILEASAEHRLATIDGVFNGALQRIAVSGGQITATFLVGEKVSADPEITEADSACCVQDSFTDTPGTLLSVHTADNGASWVVPGAAAIIDNSGDRIKAASVTTSAAYVACTETDVQIQVEIVSPLVASVGAVVRWDGTAWTFFGTYGVNLVVSESGGNLTLTLIEGGLPVATLTTTPHTGDITLTATVVGAVLDWELTQSPGITVSGQRAVGAGNGTYAGLWFYTGVEADAYVDSISICATD